jgi:hypothetical protein
MARIENKRRKGERSLESPGMAEADRSARYRDNSSGKMRTPRNPGTTSPSGFGLERSSYGEGHKVEGESSSEPTDDNDDLFDDDDDLDGEMGEGDRAYRKLVRKGAKVAKREGLTPEQGFLRVYEEPKNSALVTLTKVHRAPVSQESEDAYTQLVEESRVLASKLGVTEPQAFAKLFASRDGRIRALAKRARGAT